MTSTDVKKISIRLLPDGFSFLNQFYPILPGADYTKRLEEGLLDYTTRLGDDIAIQQFVVENTRFCVSPLDIAPQLTRMMYEASLPQYEQEESTLDLEDDVHGIRFTFGIDSQLYYFILRNWPDVSFTHSVFELYHQWCSNERITQDCMIAEAEENYLNVLVFKEGRLQLANRFEDTGINNILYHIMNCWEQCGLDVLDDKVHLITANQELRLKVQQYIKQCES